MRYTVPFVRPSPLLWLVGLFLIIASQVRLFSIPNLVLPTSKEPLFARSDSNFFIENHGYFPNDFAAVVLAKDALLGVSRDGRLHFTVKGAPPLTMSFYSDGFTAQAEVTLIDPLSTKISFLRGNNPNQWQSNVSVWSRVRITGLLPQLTLLLSFEERRFQIEAIPDGTPNLNTVRLHITGGTIIGVTGGELAVKVGEHLVNLPLPVVDKRLGRAVRFLAPTVTDAHEMNAPFILSDAARPVHRTTSPVSVSHLLGASTFLGSPGSGPADELASAVALDSQGNVYVAGETDSASFPTTMGSAYTSYNGGDRDVFIAKLSSDLTTLIAATFLGGNNSEKSNTIGIDSQGNVYVAGYTESVNFPMTAISIDASHNGSEDAFVAKLSSDLSTLITATFIGGDSNEAVTDLYFDAQSNIYVAGYTRSTNFPTTTSTTHYGETDAFIAKLNSDLSTLIAATLLGGSVDDGGITTVVLDSSGYVYVAGDTYSADFPVTSNAVDTGYNGDRDAFIAKLSNDLSNRIAVTFIGGSDWDEATTIALDDQGGIYIAGNSQSSNFPTTLGVVAPFKNSFRDAFIAKLSNDLSALTAATFLGGTGSDFAMALVLDNQNNIYVAGYTSSPDFPISGGTIDPTYNGNFDGFIVRLSSDLRKLSAATFIGGSNQETVTSIALDTQQNLYVVGMTSSADFQTTSEVYDPTYNTASDVFISKLTLPFSLYIPLTVR
jgi:hypothetical protein